MNLAVLAASLTAAQLVANVDAAYANVTTYRTSFTQTFFARAYNTTKVERGTMSIVRPSQMSFAYQNGDTVSVNASTAVACQNGSCMTQQISQTTFPALAFLAGGASLASSFTFVDPPTPFQGGYMLVGTPMQPMGAYTKAVFFVDGQTSHVRRITLLDAQGNRNTFEF